MAQESTPAYDFHRVPPGSTVKERPVFDIEVPNEHKEDAEPFTFYIRQMNVPENMLADDLTDRLCKTYINGDPERGIQPLPLAGTDVGVIKPSRFLFRAACRMATMMAPPSGAVAPDAMQFCAMSIAYPQLFGAVTEACLRVDAGLTPQGEFVEGAQGDQSPETSAPVG